MSHSQKLPQRPKKRVRFAIDEIPEPPRKWVNGYFIAGSVTMGLLLIIYIFILAISTMKNESSGDMINFVSKGMGKD